MGMLNLLFFLLVTMQVLFLAFTIDNLMNVSSKFERWYDKHYFKPMTVEERIIRFRKVVIIARILYAIVVLISLLVIILTTNSSALVNTITVAFTSFVCGICLYIVLVINLHYSLLKSYKKEKWRYR